MFGRVVVELLPGDNFARNGGDRIVVTKHRALKLSRLMLASADALLDDYFSVVVSSGIHGGAQFATTVHLGNSHRRAEVSGFDKHGIRQLAFNQALDALGFALPVVSQDGHVFDDGKTSSKEQLLHYVFIHACGRPQHSGANIRDVCKLQQPLDGAILAESSVQHGKDEVYVDSVI